MKEFDFHKSKIHPGNTEIHVMNLLFPFGVVILMGISKSKIHYVIHNRVFQSSALAWNFDSPYPRWSASLADISVHWKVRCSTKGRFRQDCRLLHLWCYCVTGKMKGGFVRRVRGKRLEQGPYYSHFTERKRRSPKIFKNDTETQQTAFFVRRQ